MNSQVSGMGRLKIYEEWANNRRGVGGFQPERIYITYIYIYVLSAKNIWPKIKEIKKT